MPTIYTFSDSHGSTENMKDILRTYRPDLVIHCGDYSSDCEELKLEFPNLLITGVCGNCDRFTNLPVVQSFNMFGKKLFITHGHNYGVKSSIDRLCYAGLEAGADIIVFGHTHIPFYDRRLAIDIINPGSIGRGARPSYAIIKITEDGEVTVSHIEI